MKALMKWLPILCLVVAGMIGVAVADVAQTQYNDMSHVEAAPAVAQVVTSTTDSGTTWAAGPLRPLRTLGNPSIDASVTMSLSEASARVEVGLYTLAGSAGPGVYTYLGIADVQTATTYSTASQNAGRYQCKVLKYDTLGADYVDVRVTAVTGGGTYQVTPWLHGSKSGNGRTGTGF